MDIGVIKGIDRPTINRHTLMCSIFFHSDQVFVENGVYEQVAIDIMTTCKI